MFKHSKNKKRILLCVYVYSFCICLGSVAQSGSFVIGVEDVNYYPYFDFTSTNTSFAKALFDQFAKDNGHQISYLPLPIKQFPKWLYEENIDFKFPDNARWQEASNVHQLKIHFSNEIVAMTAGTLVVAKNQYKEEVFFKNIGTITGFHPTLWIKQIEQGKVTIYEDSSTKILVKYLANGLIDGLDIDLAVANDRLQKLHMKEKFVINERVAKQIYSYQMSTVKYPEIINQFNQWLVKRGKYIDTLKAEFGILAVEPNKSDIAKQ
ncbi:MAG: polar amino acid transport system substrate-binding protein [Paraglaciecola sp.]